MLAAIVLSTPALPTILQFTRLVRLSRLVRILRVLAIAGRGVHAISLSLAHRGLIWVVTLCVLLVFLGGGVVAAIEPDEFEHGFWDGVWWATVTTTTVGYGDIVPESVWGRVIATVLMIAGIGLVATLAASTATLFIGQESEPEHEEILARPRSDRTSYSRTPCSAPDGIRARLTEDSSLLSSDQCPNQLARVSSNGHR